MYRQWQSSIIWLIVLPILCNLVGLLFLLSCHPILSAATRGVSSSSITLLTSLCAYSDRTVRAVPVGRLAPAPPARRWVRVVVCAVEESRSPFLLDFIGDSQRWGRDSSAPSASSRWGQLPPGDGSFVPTEDASSRRQLAHCGHFLVPAASSSRRRLLPRAGGHFLALAASSSRRRPLPRASGHFLAPTAASCYIPIHRVSGYIHCKEHFAWGEKMEVEYEWFLACCD
jgi:hypothetical protein